MNYCGQLTPNLMWVCLADTDLQSVGATLINLVNGMNALVSIAKVDRTYKELLEVTYEWQQFYQETREDLEKANATIVEITAVRSNLLEEHTRSLQESAAAMKRHDENMKALKEEIDELRREKTNKKVGGD